MAGSMHHREGGLAHADLVTVVKKNVGCAPNPILPEEQGEGILVGVGKHGCVGFVDADLKPRFGGAERVH